MPLWFKRAGGLLPANTANEADLCPHNGKLVLAVFNRPPLTPEVQFWDISDLDVTPALLSKQPCTLAMGSLYEDESGQLHIIGSDPPARNVAPYNSIIHRPVNADYTLGIPNVVIGPSGMGFNNLGAARGPDGYVFAVEQQFASSKAESYNFCPTPDFSSLTWKTAFYTPPSDFTGRTRITYMPDGWYYVTTDSQNGYCRLARTQDFVTWKFCTNGDFGFLGPDFGDAYVVAGGPPKYDGNVTYAPWTYRGQPCVVVVWFQSNETDNGQLRVGIYLDTLTSLFSRFEFQP